MFHFTLANANIAKMIAKGSISYLKHEYGEWTSIFFDGTSVIEKIIVCWNREKMAIVSPSAKQLDDIVNQDEDLIFELPDKLEINEK